MISNQFYDPSKVFSITHLPIFAYLIGALADGSIYKNKKHYVYRIKYFQKSKDYLKHCIEPLIMKLFHKEGYYYYDKRTCVYSYEITSKHIYFTFLPAVEPFKSDNKRKVPSWILYGTLTIQYAFVRGFFDGDGSYHIHTKNSDYRVRFGQADYRVLMDVRKILQTNFNCSDVLGPYQSKIKSKPYYELHIHGLKQVKKFQSKIKPCHPGKQLDSILEQKLITGDM